MAPSRRLRPMNRRARKAIARFLAAPGLFSSLDSRMRRSFSTLDPMADTESTASLAAQYSILGFSTLDPMADTESSQAGCRS